MRENSKNKKIFSFSDTVKMLNKIMVENDIDISQARPTISNICEYLEINHETQEQIKAIPFDKVNVYYDEVVEAVETISLDKLKGVTLRELTQNSTNWFRQLENLNFSKIKNYCNSFGEMYKFLNEDALSQMKDLPIVIKINDEYFIEEGLHRLTIAKCLKIKKFKVLVKEPKRINLKMIN